MYSKTINFELVKNFKKLNIQNIVIKKNLIQSKLLMEKLLQKMMLSKLNKQIKNNKKIVRAENNN